MNDLAFEKTMTVREVADRLGVASNLILDFMCSSIKYCHAPIDENTETTLLDIIYAAIQDIEDIKESTKPYYAVLKEYALGKFRNNKVLEKTPLKEKFIEKCKKGFVYLSTDNSGYYKIGRTVGLTARERGLKCGNLGYKTIASVLADNYKVLEKRLHTYFSEKRIDGEWFDLSEDDLNVLFSIFSFRREIGVNSE